MVPEASLAAIVGRGRAAIAFFAGPSLGIGIELLSHHPNLKRISPRPIRSGWQFNWLFGRLNHGLNHGLNHRLVL